MCDTIGNGAGSASLSVAYLYKFVAVISGYDHASCSRATSVAVAGMTGSVLSVVVSPGVPSACEFSPGT
jgi:hypothetical protein